MEKIIAVITGGIGSGKTHICRQLLINGKFPVISTDSIAKIVMEYEHVKEKIINKFGDKSYENGRLNKIFISNKIFNNITDRQFINDLIHPLVNDHVNELINSYDDEIIFIESALYFESNYKIPADIIINVTCDYETRLHRLKMRDLSYSHELLIKKINSQLSDVERSIKSDIIIDNTEDDKILNIPELISQIKSKTMKMYILIKENVPLKFVPVICAHASLSAYLLNQSDELVKEWLYYSFKKVICSVSEEEFNKCKIDLHRSEIITESALDNNEVALVLLPRKEWPSYVKKFKLFNME